MGLYGGGRWYRAELRAPAQAAGHAGPRDGGERGNEVRLDVDVVGEQVLEPLAGVGDPRTDPRLDFVPGSVDAAVLAELADRRDGLVVTVHAPTVSQLFAEADAGRTLPPKSTWFEPKLHSGVFVVRRPPLDGPGPAHATVAGGRAALTDIPARRPAARVSRRPGRPGGAPPPR
jgi:uncharacterized protein (DUF1015 family)